jgi:SAM-dependent methyltransferase
VRRPILGTEPRARHFSSALGSGAPDLILMDTQTPNDPRYACSMGESQATSGTEHSNSTVLYYKKGFWSNEHTKFLTPHHRLEKLGRIVNRLARGGSCTLLDIGCGPATLKQILRPGIEYFGIDIAISDPSPNLIEADILAAPIKFEERRFDIVVAQGLFEYLGDHQDRKLEEIAHLLNPGGTFVVSYANFGHRKSNIHYAYNNIQPLERFRSSLRAFFDIRQQFPTSYNWNHGQPRRRWNRRINMHINVDIPFVGRRLGVEYFFICSARPMH